MNDSQRSEVAHSLQKSTETMRSGAHSSSGSFELVLSAVLFGLLGFGLDSLVGTRPVFMVVFVVLGFVGAAISLYYRYRYQMDRHAQTRVGTRPGEVAR